MGKVAYYANRISPNQIETPNEGYRICLGVPICRTGYQEYMGCELKQHNDYRPEWGLQDGETYKVYRPLEEVTSQETQATAEGKSVTDEHPDIPGSLVSCENEQEFGRGHIHKVRVGEPFAGGDADGETPLLADMHIKHDSLIGKVDRGVRDVSCGYTYNLTRGEDGTLCQRNIRINHVAVVPKGRAGRHVAIRDSVPDVDTIAPAAIASPPNPKEQPTFMSIFHNVFGRGVKDYAQDANTKPEDLTQLFLSSVRDAAPGEAKAEKKDDAEAKTAKSTKDEESDDKDKTIAELRAEIAELKKKAMPEAKDKKVAKDDAVDDLEDLHEDLETLKEDIVEKSGDAVEEKKDDEADDDADVIDPEDEKAAKDAAKVKGAMDSARDLVKAFKPLVARGTASKAQRDAYNGAVKSLNAVKGVAATDAYAALANVKGPDMTAAKTEPLSPYESGIFTGGSYQDNVAKFHAALKGEK